jgi:hypothetical protein
MWKKMSCPAAVVCMAAVMGPVVKEPLPIMGYDELVAVAEAEADPDAEPDGEPPVKELRTDAIEGPLTSGTLRKSTTAWIVVRVSRLYPLTTPMA